MQISFEWDSEKASSNLTKHGISFDEAVHVFNDPNHISRQDRFENGEFRWQT
ncbi:BrnT family toxin, partial [Providencia rettgeri]